MRLKDVMQTPVITITAEAPLGQARALMTRRGIAHLPVLHGGAVVGLITPRAMQRALHALGDAIPLFERLTRLDGLPVAAAMQPQVTILAPQTSVVHAAQLAWEGRTTCFLVFQAGKLAGIVTTTDLLDAFLALLDELKPGMYARILAPTSLNHTAEHVVGKALALARQQDAELTLLHVLPGLSSVIAADIDHISADIITRLYEEYQDDIMTRLAALVPAGEACRVRYQMAVGDPGSAIVRAARCLNADLIVMGRGHRCGLRRLLTRNWAREVVRRAPCPVLLVEQRTRYELVSS